MPATTHNERIAIFLPNWVGDAVMFTPALRAIRQRHPSAHVTLFGRPAPIATLTPNPWSDEILTAPQGVLAAIKLLRRRRFDLAILGPNSFRSAFIARSCASRVAGFARDGRGFLLSEGLAPPRDATGELKIISALDYYLLLAERIGCGTSDKRMELFVDQADERRTDELLRSSGAASDAPLVLLNPGASFGSSKMYPPERFAQVADELVARRQVQIIINAGPAEAEIAQAVAAAMSHKPLLNLAAVGNSLGLLKAVTRRCRLMITNDTGPRHIAAALNVPVVAIFGSTHPTWSANYFDKERIVRVDVPCGPCQQKLCRLPGPGFHVCMRSIAPATVVAAALDLLGTP